MVLFILEMLKYCVLKSFKHYYHRCPNSLGWFGSNFPIDFHVGVNLTSPVIYFTLGVVYAPSNIF